MFITSPLGGLLPFPSGQLVHALNRLPFSGIKSTDIHFQAGNSIYWKKSVLHNMFREDACCTTNLNQPSSSPYWHFLRRAASAGAPAETVVQPPSRLMQRFSRC